MKMHPQSILLFSAGSLAAAIAWLALPGKDTPPPPPPAKQSTPVPEAAHWPPERIAATLKALQEAPEGEPRLQAAIELGKIPVADIPALLESIPLIENHLLNLPCKTLLIRWAASDGEAATCWAWKKFNKQNNQWLDAFRETGASWAWHDPAGLYRWAIESPRQTEDDPVKVAELAAASEVPMLEFSDLDRVTRWLITEDPRLGIELMQKRGGFSTADDQITGRLQTPEQIQEALLACKGLDELKPNVIRGDQMVAWSLLEKWQQLDPKGFRESKYAYLSPAIDSSAYLTAAKQWQTSAAEDRVAAANRLTGDLTGTARNMQVNAITREWAAISPAEAKQWLDSLPDGKIQYRTIAECSATTNLPGALAWADSLAPADREASRTQVHDAWREANPGQQPDTSGWRPEWIEAWRDLEAIEQ